MSPVWSSGNQSQKLPLIEAEEAGDFYDYSDRENIKNVSESIQTIARFIENK